ncbi:hypothetical protein DSOL_2207 [Desulfosporosinus metallidurans]|uniref:Uncharacterized protein n=1 Tax=Desulfosporosinus metallidurans TaxID=1888891 RepID=A0A1Q8QX44_9FIRM|nr:hypothetical protein DSOL_2207 [Desulfosporosinus metallidurans]
MLPWLGSENGERGDGPFGVDGTFHVHRLHTRVGDGSCAWMQVGDGS